MESTYSVSSFSGLVSSKRRLVWPAEFGGEAEVETDGFGVADVEISVGLGRETGLHAAAVFVGLEVIENDVAQEVRRTRLGRRSDGSFGLGIRGAHKGFFQGRRVVFNIRRLDARRWPCEGQNLMWN